MALFKKFSKYAAVFLNLFILILGGNRVHICAEKISLNAGVKLAKGDRVYFGKTVHSLGLEWDMVDPNLPEDDRWKEENLHIRPMLWRYIADSEGRRIFLSEYILFTRRYHSDSTRHENWIHSELYQWLQRTEGGHTWNPSPNVSGYGFLEKRFTMSELAMLAPYSDGGFQTKVTLPATDSVDFSEGEQSRNEVDDGGIFGFTDNEMRKAFYRGTLTNGRYRLRTPQQKDPILEEPNPNVYICDAQGRITLNSTVRMAMGIRPALNLDFSKMLFATEIVQEGSVNNALGRALYPYDDTDSYEFIQGESRYKLTLLGEDGGEAVGRLSWKEKPPENILEGEEAVSSVQVEWHAENSSLAQASIVYKIVNEEEILSGYDISVTEGNVSDNGIHKVVVDTGRQYDDAFHPAKALKPGKYTLFVWLQKNSLDSSHEASYPLLHTFEVLPDDFPPEVLQVQAVRQDETVGFIHFESNEPGWLYNQIEESESGEISFQENFKQSMLKGSNVLPIPLKRYTRKIYYQTEDQKGNRSEIYVCPVIPYDARTPEILKESLGEQEVEPEGGLHIEVEARADGGGTLTYFLYEKSSEADSDASRLICSQQHGSFAFEAPEETGIYHYYTVVRNTELDAQNQKQAETVGRLFTVTVVAQTPEIDDATARRTGEFTAEIIFHLKGQGTFFYYATESGELSTLTELHPEEGLYLQGGTQTVEVAVTPFSRSVDFSVTDPYGISSEAAHCEIRPYRARPPEIIQQPKALWTGASNRTVTLSIEAKSPDGGKIHYAWKKMENNNLVSVQDGEDPRCQWELQEGENQILLYCEVTNWNPQALQWQYESVLTGPFEILAEKQEDAQKPMIIRQSHQQTIGIREALVLTVEAAVDHGELAYQWYRLLGKDVWQDAVEVHSGSNYPISIWDPGVYYFCPVVQNIDRRPEITGRQMTVTSGQSIRIQVIEPESQTTEEASEDSKGQYTGNQGTGGEASQKNGGNPRPSQSKEGAERIQDIAVVDTVDLAWTEASEQEWLEIEILLRRQFPQAVLTGSVYIKNDAKEYRNEFVRFRVSPNVTAALSWDRQSQRLTPIPIQFQDDFAVVEKALFQNIVFVRVVPGFGDTKNHWAEQEINRAAQLLLVSGVGNNRYQPESFVTRSEFTQMLVFAVGMTRLKGSFNGYLDVAPSDWSYEAVLAAQSGGLLEYVKGAYFFPDRPITREEAALETALALRWRRPKIYRHGMRRIETASTTVFFQDALLIQEPFVSAVQINAELGIFQGYPEGTFCPGEKLTRAQAAAILNRLLGVLEYS